MQASETTSDVLCECEALATFRFRKLGHHFEKPGDFEDISVSRITYFVQGAGLLNAAQKTNNCQRAWVTVVLTLLYSILTSKM